MKYIPWLFLVTACGHDPAKPAVNNNTCTQVAGTDTWECVYPDTGMKCEFRIKDGVWMPLGCSKI